MNWTEHDAPRHPVDNDVKDELEFSERASVNITYSPYRSGFFWIALPYESEKRFDVNDRDGTRRMVLRELLPLAEAALVALRQAVAESEPPADDWSEPTNGIRDPETGVTRHPEGCSCGSPDCPQWQADNIDIVEFANDLMRGHKQPEGQ